MAKSPLSSALTPLEQVVAPNVNWCYKIRGTFLNVFPGVREQAEVHASTCQQSPATDWCIQHSFSQHMGMSAVHSASPPSSFPLVSEAEPIQAPTLGSIPQDTTGKMSVCSFAHSSSRAVIKRPFTLLSLVCRCRFWSLDWSGRWEKGFQTKNLVPFKTRLLLFTWAHPRSWLYFKPQNYWAPFFILNGML